MLAENRGACKARPPRPAPRRSGPVAHANRSEISCRGGAPPPRADCVVWPVISDMLPKLLVARGARKLAHVLLVPFAWPKPTRYRCAIARLVNETDSTSRTARFIVTRRASAAAGGPNNPKAPASTAAGTMTTGLAVDVQLLAGLCPSCPIGERARAEFCNTSPDYYLSLVVLPFALMALVGLWVGRASFAPRATTPVAKRN